MTSTRYAFLRALLLGTSCLSLAVALAVPAQGQPAGGVIAAGQASITNSAGNLTTVRQTTNKALINWQSFSLAAGETVQFVQPGSSAITLNRVLGADPSAIFGNLFANGQVWLINSNGVLFGKGSKTNVGGLIATTADIADRDFMSGNYNFSSASGAAVVNQGSIRTSNGGSAILSGARVANEGIIAADSGTVVLGGAGAFTVDFVGDNLLRYAITAPAGQASDGPTGVSNTGTIQANGGRVLMTVRAASNIADAVVNNSGMVTATSASVQNGEVVLDAGDGTATVSGSINASGTGSGETGGSVAITGANVNVADNTQINVSGDAGGGSVRIGGNAHGAGPLQNADNTTVGAATIRADAVNSGDGGSLVVWSNGTTKFSGSFSATGGASGGNGGSLETSGHILNVASSATVDTLAPKGDTGNWLLDPTTINIESVGTDPISGSNISPTTLINALQLSDVTLQATSSINVLSSVVYSKPTTLNLLSQGPINISASIQNSGTGGINLVAGWDGATFNPAQFGNAGVYGAAGGDVSITGGGTGVSLGSHGGATNVYAANVSLDGTNGFAQLGYHGAGGGDINMLATGTLTLTAGAGATDFALIGNGSTIGDVPGNITGNIDINVQGDTSLNSSSDTGNVAWVGNFAGSTYSETGNVVIVSSRIHSGGSGTFNVIVEAGLSGGDYTVGLTNPSNTDSINTPTNYNSAHTLNILSAGTFAIDALLQNSGSGAINIVTGWDGHTLTPSSFGNAGVYGIGGNGLTVGGVDALGNSAVGSAGGTTSLYGASISLSGTNGYAQIGYHGAGGGNINLTTLQDLSLTGAAGYAMIGNGSLSADVVGNVTGNINADVPGMVHGNSSSGALFIGNQTSSGTESGNVVLVMTQNDGNAGNWLGSSVLSDIEGGDVTLGFTSTDNNAISHSIVYSSPHTFNILTAGNFAVEDSWQNSGTGAINLVAGWNGTTLDPAHFGDAGVFGNAGYGITIGGSNALSNSSFGSAGGATSLYGASLSLLAVNGYAQLGYHGAGGGNINVVSSGTLALTAGSGSTEFAMIGNGSPLADVVGDITGNINVKAVGVATFTSTSDAGNIVWIGNIAQAPATESGSVVYVTYSTDNTNAASGFETNILADLNGGDFTFGETDPTASSKINSPFVYNSPHTLNILLTGSFGIWSTVQNSGTGAINLVVGWDGTTLNPAHFADAGVFGNNSGSILIGGASAGGSSIVGSAGGATQVLGNAVTVDASVGDAQIGFSGAGSGAITVVGLTGVSVSDEGHSAAQIGNGIFNTAANSGGNISVSAPNGIVSLSTVGSNGSTQIGNGADSQSGNFTGNVTVSGQSVLVFTDASTSYAQIGNGGASTHGSFGGNILVTATAGAIDLSAPISAYAMIGNGGSGTVGSASGTIGVNASTGILLDGSSGGFVQIGNGGYQTNLTPATGFSDTGDITINAADVVLVSSTTTASSEQIGNGGTLAGLSTGGSTSGSIAFGGNILINASQSISISTSFGNSFAQIGNGGAAAASGLTLTGGSVSFSGNITLNVGTVSQAGALLLTGSGATPTTNDVSMIGNGGAGTGQNSTASQGISASGNIAVTVLGGSNHGASVDLTAVATAGPTFDLAGIGNLNFGSVTGNIALTVDGDVQLNSGTNASAYIGTFSNIGTSSGNLTVIARSLTGIDLSLPNDISNGDVLIEITGPATFSIANNVDYSSAHTLTLLDVGDVQIENASIENAGSGVINIVSGWDGTTTNSARFGDVGVYGNNDSAFTITGGVTGAAVGSNAGATNVYADNVSIVGTNSYAQLGYNGSGGGAINLVAAGDVNVINQSGATQFAMIGNGGNSVAGNVGGAITVNAAGNVTVEESADSDGSHGVAIIGNMGGGGVTSQSGNISVTAGQALTVDVSGVGGLANVGNMAYANTTGGATGNITLHSAALTIEDLGDNGRAVVGDGGNWTNGGATSGDIAITTGTLEMLAPTSPGQLGQARITNRGTGPVSGNISIAASGNIVEMAGDGTLIEIGNGENGSSTTSGDITVQSGGTISLASTGAGEARIGAAAAPDSNVSVSAASDITLSTAVDEDGTAANGLTIIGNIAGGASAVGGNVTVTSTHGGISLNADEDQSSVSIGNGGGAPTTGTVTVTASNGNLALDAGGTGAIANIGNSGDSGDASGNVIVSSANIALAADGSAALAQIGNGGPLLSGNAGGDVTVTDAGTLNLVADGEGSFAQIGNGDALHTGPSTGNVSGNINVHVAGLATLNSGAGTAWIGNLADHAGIESGNVVLVAGDLDGGSAFSQNIVADLGGGDVTVGVTDTAATGTIDQNVAYDSAHTFNALYGGSLVFAATVQNSGTGTINIVAGWDGTTLTPASFANAGVFGNHGGTVTIGGASALGDAAVGSAGGSTSVLASGVLLLASNGFAQLGYHGAGGGSINLTTLHDLSLTATSGYAMVGNGSLNDDVSGNVTGDINIHVAGIVHDNAPENLPVFYGNATSGGTAIGNLTFVLASEDGTSNDAIGNSVMADIVGGNVTIGFTTTTGNSIQRNNTVSSTHTLSILSSGDLTVAGELQNSGSGAINLVAGWDGHTLTPSAFGNAGVFGNNGHSVLIGGSSATQGSGIGSAGGTTSIYAASLAVTATNGFAQLGFNGAGTGALVVDVTGGVTVTAGSGTGQFAQVGNGGRNTTGNSGGNISVTAGGDVVLSGGSGTEAYAQVGHGGAESNSNGNGYSNVAPITISAANVLLSAGSGQAGYVQIGNGGYKSGAGLAEGSALNGGDITITSGHAVGLQGNGADAYAQIGNGGSQSNLNPAAAAGGIDSGNIVVHAPNGSAGAVTLTAGPGANAYAQIGNGGYSVNAGASATIASFTVVGNVSVTDLSLNGGNNGSNAYAQIGNGDAALASYGDVSGNILIDANGNIGLTKGSAPNSPAVIGNFTGNGTEAGSVGGVTPPGSTIINDPVTQGVIVSQTTTPPTSPIVTIETDIVPTGPIDHPTTPSTGPSPDAQGPIAQLSNSDGDTPYTSDSATVIIADSLDGSTKAAITQQILGGYLSQIIPAAGGLSVHGIRSVDQDFSSWGNEALWQ